MTRELPRIFVSVGTDHHRFDRLIQWVDRWLEAGGRERATVFVQHGTSAPPRVAQGKASLSGDEMREHAAEASIVVAHGGPSTIMEARDLGRTPIVVARRPDLGEHVDGHQVAFSERLAAAGQVALARTEDEFAELLDLGLREPGTFSAGRDATETALAIRRFEEAIAGLDAGRRRRLQRPVRVLFVGGVGRSGSTLLDRMLGQVPGFWSVGELVHVWLRGLKEDTLCACGEHFSACDFWQRIGKRAFGGWDRLDPDQMVAWHTSVDRHRYVPLMIAPGSSPAYRRRLEGFADVLERLYRALAEETGSEVIVDSSKHASYGYLLRRVSGLDLRAIHLTRDARGVAYSWTKRVRRPEVTTSEAYMAQYHPARMTGRWLAYNLLLEGLPSLGVPTLHVSYEQLVRRPTPSMQRILRFAGHVEREGDLGFLGPEGAELGVGHSVAGNPMRFTSGPVQLRLDEAWRERMSPRDRTIVSGMTWPLLHRYGYRVRRR